MAFSPSLPEEATKLSTKLSTGRQIGPDYIIYPAGDEYTTACENKDTITFIASYYYSLLANEEQSSPEYSTTRFLDMTTWIRSIIVSLTPGPYKDIPEPETCLLDQCKLPKLQHVTIVTQANKWPWVRKGQPTAAACLKQLRVRFGKGLRLVYHKSYIHKKTCYWRVPHSFVNLLCALTEDREGQGEWEDAWLEDQFHPIGCQSVFGGFPPEFLSNLDAPSAD